MLINVFNKETAELEKIDSSKLTWNHVHRNSKRAFTKEEIASFGVKAK
jgi:hypothetical protein